MAAHPPAGAAISETAKAEGGSFKGSTSAQMQSEVGKQRNFEQAAQEVGSKMQNAPETVTSQVSLSTTDSQYHGYFVPIEANAVTWIGLQLSSLS